MKILTFEGFKEFDGIISQGFVSKLLRIQFKNNISIDCTYDHKFLLPNMEFIEANSLKPGDILFNSKEVESIDEILLNEDIEVFDALNVADNHTYLTNNIVSSNCLLLDEFAHVDNLDEFYASTYPVISSGKNTKVIITSTPNGMNLFYKLFADAEVGRNSFVPLRFTWKDHPRRDEKWFAETSSNMSPEKFDVEFNAQFFGSSNTLVSGSVLKSLVFKSPDSETSNLNFNVYFEPKEGHSYVASVDVGEGIGQDYSVINIIDISERPFKQVAVYRNNEIIPIMFVNTLYKVAKSYNDAFCVIETNSVGKIVADALYYDFEYENMLVTRTKGGESEVSFKAEIIGLRQTSKTKRIGCASLKALIESHSLLINDFETIQELSVFIRKNNSYQAEKTKNDDIVMTLVMFGWLVEQSFFEELTNDNIKSQLREKYHEMLETVELPVGFFSDGIHDDDNELFLRGL